jgi:hypothetical protein
VGSEPPASEPADGSFHLRFICDPYGRRRPPFPGGPYERGRDMDSVLADSLVKTRLDDETEELEELEEVA